MPVSHGLPASASLHGSDAEDVESGAGGRGGGAEGGGVGSVLAKMTRCKPDQRRWSFCESVTAGARDGCEGMKKGGGAGDRPRREETKLRTDLLLQTGTFTRAARFKRGYTR